MSGSYKLDEILTMLDQVLMRLDRIEKSLYPKRLEKDFNTFEKSLDKPKLTVVQSNEDNIVEFGKDET